MGVSTTQGRELLFARQHTQGSYALLRFCSMAWSSVLDPADMFRMHYRQHPPVHLKGICWSAPALLLLSFKVNVPEEVHAPSPLHDVILPPFDVVCQGFIGGLHLLKGVLCINLQHTNIGMFSSQQQPLLLQAAGVDHSLSPIMALTQSFKALKGLQGLSESLWKPFGSLGLGGGCKLCLGTLLQKPCSSTRIAVLQHPTIPHRHLCDVQVPHVFLGCSCC